MLTNRPGHRKAAELAPQLIAALKQHCADAYPDMKVTIRRSVRPSPYGARRDTYVNVSWAATGPSEVDVHLALHAVARGLGFPTHYLNIRHRANKP